jgi:formylglycine-generating enzyme required for sulfatase activity
MAMVRWLAVLCFVTAVWADTPSPASPCPAGMVLVPAGRFVFGPTGESAEDPYFLAASSQTVAPFCMDAREVSVGAFAAFGKPAVSGDCPVQRDGRRSVSCVTFLQAEGFCAARGGRLPSEVEWEFAARGVRSTAFPWGEGLVTYTPLAPNLCLLRQERTGSQGACVSGASVSDRTPLGIFDLGFNLSEWTSSILLGTERRVIRGGNWTLRIVAPVASQRMAREVSYFHSAVGFRCVANERGKSGIAAGDAGGGGR